MRFVVDGVFSVCVLMCVFCLCMAWCVLCLMRVLCWYVLG